MNNETNLKNLKEALAIIEAKLASGQKVTIEAELRRLEVSAKRLRESSKEF